MPTATRPTRENLNALQELDRLFWRNNELDRSLREIRDLLARLDVQRKFLEVADPKLRHDHPHAAETREQLRKLAQDVEAFWGNVDLYSLGEAITRTGRLDQLLEEAHTDLTSELLGDENG